MNPPKLGVLRFSAQDSLLDLGEWFSSEPKNQFVDQVFIDYSDFRGKGEVVALCAAIRKRLDELLVVRYEPIIVGIAHVPSGRRNKVVEELCRADIPSVSLTYEKYLEIVDDVSEDYDDEVRGRLLD